MYVIGIDLAITGSHQAVLVDPQGQYVGRPWGLTTEPAALAQLLHRVPEQAPVQVVMEPTGLSWLPVASYLIQRQVPVYLVNSQQVAQLRKALSKHANSDRISARILARLPWIDPAALHPLSLPTADYLNGQRWCKLQERLTQQISAIENRIQAWERAYWPGLEAVVGALFAPWVCRWRETHYAPWQLAALAEQELAAFLAAAGAKPDRVPDLAQGLQAVARRTCALFGAPQGNTAPHADYSALQATILSELRIRATLLTEVAGAQHQVQGLYQRVAPARHLETLRGVGPQGAAVYTFFVHDVLRFPTQKAFRGWSGMIPRSDQSGDVEKKGLPISAAGPDLIKKYAYINAEVARQWDPQLAAIYYDQMTHKGQHHSQAVCCCATHLLDRVRAILRDNRPYQLRDVDGQPVSPDAARTIVLTRYHVPDAVRRRTRHRTRKLQRDQRAERQQRKEEKLSS